MGLPLQAVRKRTRVRIRTLILVVFLGAQAVIEAPSSSSPSEQTKQANHDSAGRTVAPAEKAWRILHEGLREANSERRAKAVRALGLLAGSAEAEKGGSSRIARRKTECAVQRQPRPSFRCTPSIRRAISKKR